MKIFFPVEVFYPSQAGGPANTVYWITKNLVGHGVEPVVVATNKGIGPAIPLNQWTDTDGGRVIYVKTRFDLLPFRQVSIALRHFAGADVVHLSSIFFPTAFLTAFAARIFSKGLIWSPRGELDPAALTHSPIRKKPVLWLIRKIMGSFPVFHSTCDEETRYIKDVFGDGVRVEKIPNFLEIPAPVTREPDTYLLYIGRIHPKKAIDNLLKALAESSVFPATDRKLKIAGVGKPGYERELRDLAANLGLTDRVEFLGQVEGVEKQRLLANALWTIMPSHTENFGIVVLESLAQSTPVVASKGTPWAVLESENVGVWAENSVPGLAAAIDKVLSIPAPVYEEMRSRCRSFVAAHFDIKQNINKWLDLYKNLK